MSTKQKLVVALAVTVTGLCAVQAARPAHRATSCQKPVILATRWIFSSVDVSQWTVQYEVAADTHGAAGSLHVNYGGLDPEQADLSSSQSVQTAVISPVDWWYTGETERVPVSLITRCGSTTQFVAPAAPHAGHTGAQKFFSCADYIVLDSRGSTEHQDFTSPAGALFASKFRRLHPSASLSVLNNPYPAAGGLRTMLAAAAKLPGSTYSKSVIQGTDWLYQELSELPTTCPVSLIFVTGYSQGAQVAGDVALENRWNNIGGVILFGDPYFNPRESFDRGDYSSINWGSLGIRRVPFNGPNPYVLSYCHLHDPVCQGPQWIPHYHFYAHTNYDQLGEPQEAARHFTKLWG